MTKHIGKRSFWIQSRNFSSLSKPKMVYLIATFSCLSCGVSLTGYHFEFISLSLTPGVQPPNTSLLLLISSLPKPIHHTLANNLSHTPTSLLHFFDQKVNDYPLFEIRKTGNWLIMKRGYKVEAREERVVLVKDL